MRNRVYVRAFDWDEARRLHDEGHSYSAIARRYGVTPAAVRRVLVPGLREKINARAVEWVRENHPHVGPCVDCGEPCSSARYRHGARCKACDTKAKATSVHPDALRCCLCQLWLPDEDFSPAPSKAQRRGRTAECKPCLAQRKRDDRRFRRNGGHA